MTAMTLTQIQIQDAYIARVLRAHSKITARTKGHRFNRSRYAARKEAVARLLRMGYAANEADQIVKDAHDMFLLEAAASD